MTKIKNPFNRPFGRDLKMEEAINKVKSGELTYEEGLEFLRESRRSDP